MSNLKELLARANAKIDAPAAPAAKDNTAKVKPAPTHEPHITKVESAAALETNQFDDLDDFMTGLNQTAVPPNFNQGVTKDGNKLQVGDPVVGLHQGQRMSGQVIAVQGDNATVEWKDRRTSTVPINTLELTDVDTDYEEEALFIEAAEPIQTMGFDKESFVEDTDLESLLRGGADGTSSGFKYENSINDL